MIFDFKNIYIGKVIKKSVEESKIDYNRICDFIKCSEEELHTIFESESFDTNILLRLSEIIEYDFFRIYN